MTRVSNFSSFDNNNFITKQTTLKRRSAVLSLLFQLVFPDLPLAAGIDCRSFAVSDDGDERRIVRKFSTQRIVPENV